MAAPSAPAPGGQRRLDHALVTRILSLNPSCLHLNLSRNNITCASGDADVLAPLRALLQLNLSSNALRRLGPEFSALTQLQVLDVSRNQMCAPRHVPPPPPAYSCECPNPSPYSPLHPTPQ